MFRSRASRAVIAAFVVAGSCAMTPGTSQAAARVRVPWSGQTVFALAPDRSDVAEWNGPGADWTIIGGPAWQAWPGGAGLAADGS